MTKKIEDKELFEGGEEMTEGDLCDDCPMCLATKYYLRFGRYPHPRELGEFLKSEREKSTKC